ncbi:hypothetical protein [Candidatus Caldatribacterium sp.]|uniref:hypothetical protein n=1 Tax=Candidatus Caldatribacterium sp. TaxID=2282143 RepID=UPI0038483966|nr:hypothetical protein [Candidatus Caldatribacterium sp.]
MAVKTNDSIRVCFVGANLEDELVAVTKSQEIVQKIEEFLNPFHTLFTALQPDPPFSPPVYVQNLRFLTYLNASLNIDPLTGTVQTLSLTNYPPLFYRNPYFYLPIGFSGVEVRIFHNLLNVYAPEFSRVVTVMREVARSVTDEFSHYFRPSHLNPLRDGHVSVEDLCVLIEGFSPLGEFISDPLLILLTQTHTVAYVNQAMQKLVGDQRIVGRPVAWLAEFLNLPSLVPFTSRSLPETRLGEALGHTWYGMVFDFKGAVHCLCGVIGKKEGVVGAVHRG